MRDDVRRRPSDELVFLFYLGAHVIACGLGYLLGELFIWGSSWALVIDSALCGSFLCYSLCYCWFGTLV